MSYGTPTLDVDNRTYRVVVAHPVSGVQIAASLQDVSLVAEVTTDTAVQDFLDALDAAGFTVLAATKDTPSLQTIEVTP